MSLIIKGRNELIPFTRRYPDLKQKQALRDSKIAKQIITAWDVNKSQEEVLRVFLKDNSQLSNPRYWELLKSVWIICGSLENQEVFRKLMSSTRPFKAYFMSPEEKEAFDNLPEEITAYRACNGDDKGLSYTLSREYAEQYRDMYDKELIHVRKINKVEIFAFINRNAEEELIIL